MKRLCRAAARFAVIATVMMSVFAQAPEPAPASDLKLPNGKTMAEELLKADHKKSLQDLDQIMELARSMKEEMEKNDRHVLSIPVLKKTEEIEKLARRIRSRMRRF